MGLIEKFILLQHLVERICIKSINLAFSLNNKPCRPLDTLFYKKSQKRWGLYILFVVLVQNHPHRLKAKPINDSERKSLNLPNNSCTVRNLTTGTFREKRRAGASINKVTHEGFKGGLGRSFVEPVSFSLSRFNSFQGGALLLSEGEKGYYGLN